MSDLRAAQQAWNTLLLWCSEAGSGAWKSFSAACAYLGLPAGRASRVLSQLAHVEFDRRVGRFACAPTALTTIPGMPGRLLLTGARPGGMLDGLRRIAELQGFDVDVAAEPLHQFGNGPGTALVDADGHAAQAFADAAGIAFIPNAHRRLAALLPPAELGAVAAPAAPDDRFPHCPVEPEDFRERWDSTRPEGSDGLWRWRTWDRSRVLYLRRDAHWWHLPVAEYGAYLVERPQGCEPLARYEGAHRLLIVEGTAPLPPLHARAACLCSGRLPLRQPYAPGHWEEHYVNVDRDTAAAILTTLKVAT